MRSLALAVALALLPAPLGLPYVGVDDGAVAIAAAPSPTRSEDANDRARRLGRKAARDRGWTGRQWECLDTLIKRESNWRPNAQTGSHYGIGQVRGMKPGTPVDRQLQIVFRYIVHRYGTPCKALEHSYKWRWY